MDQCLQQGVRFGLGKVQHLFYHPRIALGISHIEIHELYRSHAIIGFAFRKTINEMGRGEIEQTIVENDIERLFC